MQHDMHRVIGWGRQLGHYIDGEMVRVLRCIEYPENEEEHVQLQDHVARELVDRSVSANFPAPSVIE
ncbi:hypothetical protein ASD52_36390 [Ensifer sp. Root142]|nr:hypothetical protein ASD52_36390 [Ensifer sp. Root142]